MREKRDEFPARVRHQIERKSSFRCSNPACRRTVIGPSADFKKVVYMGEIAHICAAEPNGPRYDPSMSAEERSSEENGILLCRYCAALVDVDELSYPPELLRLWKTQAYQSALELLSLPGDNTKEVRCWSTVRELVRECLCIHYQTQGRVSRDARFRSYAGILYELFFEDLPKEADSEKQAALWTDAVQRIAADALVNVRGQTTLYDCGFPRRYRCLMEELKTYSFRPDAQKEKVLNIMEAEIRSLFRTGEVFGLRENNSRERV